MLGVKWVLLSTKYEVMPLIPWKSFSGNFTWLPKTAVSCCSLCCGSLNSLPRRKNFASIFVPTRCNTPGICCCNAIIVSKFFSIFLSLPQRPKMESAEHAASLAGATATSIKLVAAAVTARKLTAPLLRERSRC